MRSQQFPGPSTTHLFGSGCAWESRFLAAPSGETGTPLCRRCNQDLAGSQIRGGQQLAKQLRFAPKREGPRLSAGRGSLNCLHFRRNSADDTGLFHVHVCTVCIADLWFLLSFCMDTFSACLQMLSADAAPPCQETGKGS